MIAVIAELLSGALELAEPILGLVGGMRRAHESAPGDFYRARMRLEITGYIRGEPRTAFHCIVQPSMLVQVAEEQFATNGDTLVLMCSLTHAASLPREYQARAIYPGYLLRIPALTRTKSFKFVPRAI